MSRNKDALLRVVTGRGIIARPAWLEKLLTAFDRHETAIDLSSLSDAALDDIGVTRAEVEAMMNKPRWDAPLHWYRT